MKILLILAVSTLLMSQTVNDDLRARYHQAQHELFLVEQLAGKSRIKYAATMKELNAACGTGRTVQIDGSGEPVCVKQPE